MKTALVLLSLIVMPHADAAAQVPRDTPPPAIENARHERDLRAAVAAGTATKDTYLELARLANLQNRFADTVAALRGAAALEPASAEAVHRIGTICWDYARRDTAADPATRQTYIREGIAAEDQALAIKADYGEALTYKNFLLRLQANLSTDPAERKRLIAEAEALLSRALALPPPVPPAGAPPPPAPPLQGFPETFEGTMARLTPVRVGGGIRQPAKTRDAKPVYPADAQAARVQGVVIVEAIIDPSGAIANARVLRSVPLLDDAALSAVSRWRYTATEVNGVPASVLVTVTVNFALQERD
jgi:TonB family protein